MPARRRQPPPKPRRRARHATVPAAGLDARYVDAVERIARALEGIAAACWATTDKASMRDVVAAVEGRMVHLGQTIARGG